MKKTKYIRVFQMSFDIAEPENMDGNEIASLKSLLEETIDNFNDIHGKALGFKSLGSGTVDMRHAYDEDMIDDLNK